MARSRLSAKKVTAESRPVFDDGAGSVDIWPIMAADATDLAAEIERGDHDPYLSLLAHCDRAQHDGGRPLVQGAVKRRMG